MKYLYMLLRRFFVFEGKQSYSAKSRIEKTCGKSNLNVLYRAFRDVFEYLFYSKKALTKYYDNKIERHFNLNTLDARKFKKNLKELKNTCKTVKMEVKSALSCGKDIPASFIFHLPEKPESGQKALQFYSMEHFKINDRKKIYYIKELISSSFFNGKILNFL